MQQLKLINALYDGAVLLVARHAFSTEEELRQNFPPPIGKERIWRKNATLWLNERRHLYVACINPQTKKIITSSAKPNRGKNPWCLQFCSDEMALTILDINALVNPAIWENYNVSAKFLNRIDYTPDKIASVITAFREKKHCLQYSIDFNHGYDCQTATRDVLWSANKKVDPRKIKLPKRTKVLAYYSQRQWSLENVCNIC